MVAAETPTKVVADVAHDDVDRRRFVWACAVGSIASAGVFIWMLNGGRLNFLQRQPLGGFFDAQAHSLLSGRWDVPSGSVFIEGIRLRGRYYTYFGPWPAVLRMPVALFTRRFDDRLTQPSILLAFVVIMASTCRLHWRLRKRVRGLESPNRLEWWAIALFTFCVGAGSAVLFLASRAFVYHESLAWAVAGTMASADALVAFVDRSATDPDRANRQLLLAGVWATIAVVSRPAVGAAPLVAFAVVLVCDAAGIPRLRRLSGLRGALGTPERLQRWWPLTVAVLVIPVALYAWVNYMKFHTFFSVPFGKQVFTQIDAQQRAALRANGGSLFGLKYVPTTLLQYLRPDALRFAHLFPFVGFGNITNVLHARFDRINATASVPSTMPGLVALAIVGGISIFRAQAAKAADLVFIRVLVLASAVAIIPTVAIGYIDNHYLGDFIPLVLIPALIGFQQLLRALARSPRSRRLTAGATVVAGLLAFGVWANFGLSLVYQRELAPSTERFAVASDDKSALKAFVAFQETLSKNLHLPRHVVKRIPRGTGLPAPHFLDELAAVGDCDGLYWTDGKRWLGLESNRLVGTDSLRIRLNPDMPIGVRQPILFQGVAGHRTVVALQRLSGGRIAFSAARSLNHRFANGTPFLPKARTWHDVEVVVDPYELRISAIFDGAPVLDNLFVFDWGGPALERAATVVGRDPEYQQYGTAPAFDGEIQRRPQGRAYCQQFR